MSCRVIAGRARPHGPLIEALAPAHERRGCGHRRRATRRGTLDDRALAPARRRRHRVSHADRFLDEPAAVAAPSAPTSSIGTTGWQAEQAEVRSAIEAGRHRRCRRRRISRSARTCWTRWSSGPRRLFEPHGRLRRLHPRSASRREEGRAVGHGAVAAAPPSSAAGSRAADRHVVDSRRAHSRDHTVGFDGPARDRDADAIRCATARPSRMARSSPRAGCEAGAGWFTMRRASWTRPLERGVDS